ncbi:hypothetical protein DD595_26260 [Enterobacter cloacae complex sp. 4DZ3-17B2]|nr:hypothetical protein DD595_26260 [Enterobacter cloacae complex sp. 4DZ3-17B2]
MLLIISKRSLPPNQSLCIWILMLVVIALEKFSFKKGMPYHKRAESSMLINGSWAYKKKSF